MAKVMCIGGNFQLAEHARMFKGQGVVYVQPQHATIGDPIRANDNKYNVVTLNPDGNFDLEEVSLEDALSLGKEEDKSRFLEYAKSRVGISDLELISVGVSDGVLKDQPDAKIWSDLAHLLFEIYKDDVEYADGMSEISIISSDNAFNNGDLLRANIRRAIASDPYHEMGHNLDFKEWFDSNIHFHNTVVDRMVVGQPSEAAKPNLDRMSNPKGFTVYTEPIPKVSHKLIIEDPKGRLEKLIGKLPESERAKISRESVFPYAVAKYEALNFFHTAQVHWGYVAGLEDISANLQDSTLGDYVRKAAEAKAAIVSGYDVFKGTGIDVVALTNEFAERCNIPYLGHKNEFIVRNGTGKIIERIKGSLVETNGEVDNGMYGTIASIIREKTPVRVEQEDGPVYIGRKDNNSEYKIIDSKSVIMENMAGVDKGTSKKTIGDKVGEILGDVGLSNLSPKLQNGVTDLVYDLFQRPAMEFLRDYSARCFQ